MTNKRIIIVHAVLIILTCAFFYFNIVRQAPQYIYPLDDTYISLAISKNLALFGNWGVTKHEFSSLSSCPLYTVILAALIFVFGVNDYYPLIFNVLCFGVFLIAVHSFFLHLKPLTYLITTSFILWTAVIYTQILSGMEHMFHILAVFAVVAQANKYMLENKVKHFIYLCLLASIASAIRYESLFLVCAICLVLVLKREFIRALTLAFVAWLPLIILGLIFISKGGQFFPNSLMLKGNTNYFDILGLIGRFSYAVTALSINVPVLSGLLLTLFLTAKEHGFQNLCKLLEKVHIQLIVLITIVLHLMFAMVGEGGWVFRYEAYFLVLAGVALAPFFDELVCFVESQRKKFTELIFANFKFKKVRTINALFAVFLVVTLVAFTFIYIYVSNLIQALYEALYVLNLIKLQNILVVFSLLFFLLFFIWVVLSLLRKFYPSSFLLSEVSYPRRNLLYSALPLIIFFGIAAHTTTRLHHSALISFFANRNIYEQHLQMASFLRKYYNTAKVVANDIGAISYYSDIHLLDPIGLGSNEVAKISREKDINNIFQISRAFETEEFKRLTLKYEIAILYSQWFRIMPDNFIKVGEWTISDNMVCGSSMVSFYAIGSENKRKLKASLEDFNQYIDKDVKVKICSEVVLCETEKLY